MDKIHNVESLGFDGDNLVIRVDGEEYTVEIRPQSSRLAAADDVTRQHFVVSASGYGIHWPDLDEDLSVDALIKAALKVRH